MEQEELAKVAMEVILHAGNARNLCRDAAVKISKKQLNGVKEKLDEADKEIVLAHKAQTDLLHSEARGQKVEMTVLLSHAQDTLMNTESEKFLIDTFYNYVKEN